MTRRFFHTTLDGYPTPLCIEYLTNPNGHVDIVAVRNAHMGHEIDLTRREYGNLAREIEEYLAEAAPGSTDTYP